VCPLTGVFDRTDSLGFGYRPEWLGSVYGIIILWDPRKIKIALVQIIKITRELSRLDHMAWKSRDVARSGRDHVGTGSERRPAVRETVRFQHRFGI
jgi:hypothetical protein